MGFARLRDPVAHLHRVHPQSRLLRLDVGGDVEAQSSLSVGGRGDAEQQSAERRRDHDETIAATISKVMGFRAMHLRGRCLQSLLPKAVDDIDDYEYLDGELVAGIVVGWNFVESQPMGQPTHSWTIADATTGMRESGKMRVKDLLNLQPWPPALDG